MLCIPFYFITIDNIMYIETFVHAVLGLFFLFHGINHFIHLKELTKEAQHHKWTFETRKMVMIS